MSAERLDRFVVMAKIGALVLVLAFAPLAWVPEIRGSLAFLMLITRYGKIPAVYSGVVLLSFAGLIVTPFLRNHALRIALVAIFMSSYALDRFVFSLSGAHADTEVIRTLWQGRMLAGPAFRAFDRVILEHVAAIGALSIALAWPPRPGLRTAYGVLPIGALVIVAAYHWSWQQVVDGYPSTVAIPARFALVLSDHATTTDRPLTPVPAGHVGSSPFRKIVLIVDESVRGDYLSINNPQIDTTPFLQSAPGLINFGIATSGSNCSYQSRWMLRRGVRPWQLPEEMPISRVSDGLVNGPHNPLWQFAKAAGFRMTYIDAWSALLGPYHEATSVEELNLVDEHVNLASEPKDTRDAAAARTLVSILKRSDRAFVQVDKLGPHLPYDEFSPADFNRYARTDGSRFRYARQDRDDVVGSYKNTIAWSVDEFFRDVLPSVELRDTLILYTSDHGENLGDGGYAWGHCSTRNVHPSEAWVPLVALTGVSSVGDALTASANRSRNEATHFDIFPTLLIAMGYDPGWVSSVYGPSLFAIPAGRTRQFIVGDVRLSRWRKWLTVAPSVPPPGGSAPPQRP